MSKHKFIVLCWNSDPKAKERIIICPSHDMFTRAEARKYMVLLKKENRNPNLVHWWIAKRKV